PLQVVQADDHPGQVAVPVGVGVTPRTDVDLVQRGSVPPARPIRLGVHGPPHLWPNGCGPDLNSVPSRRRLDPVSPYLALVAVVFQPTAIGYGVIGAFRAARWVNNWRQSRMAPPEPEPIERLTATLRRLRTELEAMETRTGVPNKHVRVDALRGAYLDVLGTACRRLEVSPPVIAGHPVSPRANPAEIYRAEAALR